MNAERMAVAFARLLRLAGVDVSSDRVITFVRALGQVGIQSRQSVYWAGRATLIRRPEDIEVYDRVFSLFWLDQAAGPETIVVEEQIIVAFDSDDEDASEGSGDDEPEGEQEVLSVRYSAAEVLRNKDFALCSEGELDESRKLMAELRLVAENRPSRRQQPSRRNRGRPDLRRTVRRSMRNGGEAVVLARTAPSQRPRRIVLLCDVSGSMESYARALLRFAHVAVGSRQGGKVEAFALGTRLTRITRELSWRDPDRALAGASRSVTDWSGGTRLGEGLRQFNDRWGTRGMARGAIVVILSDGWDRGDPARLAEEMERLHRVAHRVVWVNPLKASPGYEPLARGMAAALPFVDEFVAGHSLASLEELAAVIGGRSKRDQGPNVLARRRTLS